ncbi:Undecaprenyl diphosphate synthase [hydrothermal vent metagenome]|uniref:Undecaprenyl diphosphate synthase n=1 Tax=hydrothermal vent metagenome TaxID=652676 RepID=A0A3B0RSU1_9ZZZZ
MTKFTDSEIKKFPRHVAVIMDGNGRWAHERSLPRAAGHKQGVEALRRTVRAAAELGVEFLTVYSFSSENWSRPESEIKHLFSLLRRFVGQDVAELHTAGTRIRVIGERSNLSKDIIELIEYCEDLTGENEGMTLNIAFNYGARQEIVSAIQHLANQVKQGVLEPSEISDDLLGQHLGTRSIPDPDLLIRTSGEQRLSNFLLWQCAYTEFVFVNEHWPSFDKAILSRAIEDFQNRDRRYGGLKSASI